MCHSRNYSTDRNIPTDRKITSSHTAARHFQTPTPSRNFVHKAVFSEHMLMPNQSDFGHRQKLFGKTIEIDVTLL